MTKSLKNETIETSRQHFGKAYSGKGPENYKRYFVPVIAEPLAKDIIEIASLKPGERVLDVACGTGVITTMAAEKVGSNGTAAGVDLNPGMLEVARSNTPNDISVEWYESPAEKLPLPDKSFDVVLSQLSLQFFQDKLSALKEMYRVLTPGGRLVINVPGPTPIFEAADEIFAHHLGPEAAGFVRAVFSLYDHQEIRNMINDAGFIEVNVWSEKKALHLPQPEDFLWQYMSSTPLSAFIEKSNDEKYAAFESDIVEKWQPFVKDDYLILEHDTILSTARK